jgi:hypothetical protein
MSVELVNQPELNQLPAEPRSPRQLSKRYDDHCEVEGGLQADALNTAACFLYLYNLDTTICQAQGAASYMCHSRRGGAIDAFISGFGYPIRNSHPTSYCRDVSRAVSWVSQNCPTLCGGAGLPVNYCGRGVFAAAYGNGGFVVATLGAPLLN